MEAGNFCDEFDPTTAKRKGAEPGERRTGSRSCSEIDASNPRHAARAWFRGRRPAFGFPPPHRVRTVAVRPFHPEPPRIDPAHEPDLSPQSLVARPTFVRYGVLAFACSLSMITYLDRASIGMATKPIREPSASGRRRSGLALTAFNLAYALFEVPTGWLGDVFGPRKTLIRIVLWWSLFTALTGLAGLQIGGVMSGRLRGVWSSIRFLFGVGEAGAYPNITRALHNWFPATERGFTQGSVWMSGRLMGGLTPLIWTLLVVCAALSWRGAFWTVRRPGRRLVRVSSSGGSATGRRRSRTSTRPSAS